MISFNRISGHRSSAGGENEPTLWGAPLGEVQTALRQSVAAMRTAVVEHPRTSLAAAFGAGLLIAWWIKRR
jgi:hypothetical protein